MKQFQVMMIFVVADKVQVLFDFAVGFGKLMYVNLVNKILCT